MGNFIEKIIEKIIDGHFDLKKQIEKNRHEEKIVELMRTQEKIGNQQKTKYICNDLSEKDDSRYEEQNSSSPSTSEKESDKDGISEENEPKVFIVHSVKGDDKVAIDKWKELSNNLKSLGYDVFKDEDSGRENDIRHCLNHLDGSDIIIILVGNKYPLLTETGVFRAEIEHISQGLAVGKITYVCSYGTPDVLEVAINECTKQNLKIVLEKINNNVKQHSFNYSKMKKLAKEIDECYKKTTKNDSAAKNSYREISL